MIIERTPGTLRKTLKKFRADTETVALVPTMGALHEGHLSLVHAGKARVDRVVVSVFVNPRQFAPSEDFERYPRPEEHDATLLEKAGADVLYLPGVADIYPQGFATTISVTGLTQRWEGAVRPGHFDGVATIVAKLLIQGAPDFALFGEKDYQQLQVIRRMSADLDLPVEIIGCPIVRDANGLALSSRNTYLAPEELAVARTLNTVLRDASAARFEDRAEATKKGRERLLQNGFSSVDYFEFVDASSLEPNPEKNESARLIAAARLGVVRLLDNMACI